MSKKINITEEASLSPMVCEPDTDEGLCDTIPQLQRLHITEYETSIDESDIADKVLIDSKDTQYYVTYPNTEEASNDTIKSDEEPLHVSSEGSMTKDNQRLASIQNNQENIEITEMLLTIEEVSPTYGCSNFTMEEVQICETSIKKGTFDECIPNVGDASFDIELKELGVHSSLQSDSLRDEHQTNFLYPKVKSQESIAPEFNKSLTRDSFRAIDSSNSGSDDLEGSLGQTDISSGSDTQKFRYFNISSCESSSDDNARLIGKISEINISSDTTKISQVIPKRELEASTSGSSELKQSNVSLGKRPYGLYRMPTSKIDTANYSLENSGSSDEGPLQCCAKKKRSFESEQEALHDLPAESLELSDVISAEKRRSNDSPRKRRIINKETKVKYHKRSVSVKDSETGEKSNIVIRSRSLSLDSTGSSAKLDKTEKSSPKPKNRSTRIRSKHFSKRSSDEVRKQLNL
ncbi:hypothetical protein TNIN_237831 [Trichonephila inaurata madagascariensis]|uniref:Uncharacterized protein n=1 Tax=Trichonephila inaurata madagascariensis TaxID=2747483 RepID=A0A8X6Y984_9ARAC|nr:hypothetical protein TNIN_237831 [Trichonephila inaurata madagascariensis]